MERINQRENHLLGDNIKRLREERKLRNRDVVKYLQLCGLEILPGTYSKVELGKNNPSVDMVMALEKLYQCGYKEFFRDGIKN